MSRNPSHIFQPIYHPAYRHDYDDTLIALETLNIPVLNRGVYEKMRRLFRVKHGYSLREQSWIMGGCYGLFFYGFVRRLKPDIILDIGTCRGFSALCAALALHDDGRPGIVHSIDCKKHDDYGLDPFFTELRRSRVNEIVGPSQEILPIHFDRAIDIALVDGGHRYSQVSCDLFFIVPRLATQGVVIVDDCVPEYAGIERAVAEVTDRYKLCHYKFGRVCVLTKVRLKEEIMTKSCVTTPFKI